MNRLYKEGLALWAIVALAYACVSVEPDESRCAAACSAASDCGLLPSALGGRLGASRAANEQDCRTRCLASDRRAVEVEGLLEILAADEYGDDSLCTPGGTDRCAGLVEALETTASTTELEVTSALTVRMTSAVSHAANYSIASLCCFDYGEDKSDVIATVYDMFEPSNECLGQTITLLGNLRAAHDDKTGEVDTEAATQACVDFLDLWMPVPPLAEEPPDEPCYFLQLTDRSRPQDMPTNESQCVEQDPMAIDTLREHYALLQHNLGLDAGGTLVDDQGETRSLDQIREVIEGQIDDEIDRPMGFLAEACADYDCDVPPAATPCVDGPVCSRADCLAESDACDPTLCVGETSPPAQDCDVFGVTEVRLGYRNERGLEVLGEPIDGCQTQSQLEQTFDNVGVGVITPIANVSGTLPSAFFPDGAPIDGDGSYKWSIEGTPRWVSAGQSVLTLPSPMLEFLIAELQNPLEYLRWVPRRMPLGADCVNQPRGCEGYFNDNCEDGLDNDNNGLADSDEPWCDEMFSALVARCIVEQPGGSPLTACEPVEPPPEFDD